MIRIYLKVSFILTGLVIALTACNNGTKQYPRTSYTPAKPDLEKVLGDNELSLDDQKAPTANTMGALDADGSGQAKPGKLSNDEHNKRVARNTHAPILYGKGAAGITFDMDMNKAHQILSQSDGEDEKGVMGYQEGVYVYWKRDVPRTPDQILVLGSYLGEFKELSQAFGRPIKMGSQFEEEFAKDGGKGRELIKELSRVLLKKDKDFDCIEAGICSIEYRGDELISMSIQGALISFAADRKTLRAVALTPPLELGRLNNSLDIILGQVVDKESNQAIRLGEDWKTSLEKIGVDQKSAASATLFIKDYDQAILGVTRSQFSREYKKPSGEEKLKSIIVARAYPHAIKFKDQFLKWEKASDGTVQMSFVEAAKVDGEKSLVKLNMSGLTDRATQVQFLEKLNEKILEKFQESEFGPFSISTEQKLTSEVYKPAGSAVEMKVDTAFSAKTGSNVIVQRLTGFQRRAGKGALEGVTVAYDLNRKTGRSAIFTFDTTKGSFSKFAVSAMLYPSDYMVALSAAEPISAKKHELLGLNLKTTKIELSDVDLGRKEATIKIITPNMVVTEHVNVLNPEANLSLTRAGQPEQTLQVATVELSSFKDVRLYLSDYSANPKLVAVESSQVVGGVSDVCGLKKFLPRLTQSSNSFMKDYTAALAVAKNEAKKKNENFVCITASEKDKDGSGEIKSMSFTQNQVIFKFTNNELSSVIFY